MEQYLNEENMSMGWHPGYLKSGFKKYETAGFSTRGPGSPGNFNEKGEEIFNHGYKVRGLVFYMDCKSLDIGEKVLKELENYEDDDIAIVKKTYERGCYYIHVACEKDTRFFKLLEKLDLIMKYWPKFYKDK